MTFSTGYDMKNEFRFNDGLGKMYATFAAVWSVLLLCGSLFLVANRGLPFLRIRNVPLVISAVAILHVYWVLCMVAYGLNGFFPCATEFWIMNIYLPLGIALFHLSNARLLHVAVLQSRYASSASLLQEKVDILEEDDTWTGRIRRLKNYDTYKKTKWCIAIGLMVQFTCALVIFVISRRFHNGYGLIGQSVPDTPATKLECRKGWEWVLSIAWQFFWSWIYAPYLLWKVRNIRDTHGWRMQTIVCCLAGLPASPMWLLALYLPEMTSISTYFIPPLWFAPSILLIEAFMIFLPCWHIAKYNRLKKETLEIIAKWETQKESHPNDSEIVNISQSPRRMSHKPSVVSTASSRKMHPHMYTMAALEKALQTNPTPLLLFAALKDFSGENISFLNHVREWKQNWSQQRVSMLKLGSPANNPGLRLHQFTKAVGIYSSFVSLRYSSFPINISHNQHKELGVVFEEVASIVNARLAENVNSATPFDDFDTQADEIELGFARDGLSTASTVLDSTSSNTEIEPNTSSKQSTVINVYRLKELESKIPSNMAIPSCFGPTIFDNAMESVKYMVLTNTWPKFVDAGYAANMERGTPLERLQERMSACGMGRSRICSF